MPRILFLNIQNVRTHKCIVLEAYTSSVLSSTHFRREPPKGSLLLPYSTTSECLIIAIPPESSVIATIHSTSHGTSGVRRHWSCHAYMPGNTSWSSTTCDRWTLLVGVEMEACFKRKSICDGDANIMKFTALGQTNLSYVLLSQRIYPLQLWYQQKRSSPMSPPFCFPFLCTRLQSTATSSIS